MSISTGSNGAPVVTSLSSKEQAGWHGRPVRAAGSRSDKKPRHAHSRSTLPFQSAVFLLLVVLSCPLTIVGGEPNESRHRTTKAPKGVQPPAVEEAKKPPAALNADVPTIRRKLQARTDLKVDKVPLKEVIAQLAKRHSIPIRIDENSLKKAQIAVDTPITASIKGLTLNASLRQILKDLHLSHDLKDGAIVISADAEDDLAAAGKAHVERKDEERVRAEEAAKVAEEVARVNQGRPGAGLIDPDQAEGDVQQKEFARRFKSALRAELNFVQKVCEPTDEQMAEIRQVLEKYQTDMVKKYSDIQKRVARGQRQGVTTYPDPRKLIRDSLKKTLKTTLDADRWARFDRELEERRIDQTRAAVHNVVAKIDRDITLSAEQAAKNSSKLLTAGWNPAWGLQFEMFLQQGGQFAPSLPPKLVTPHLNPIQTKIWSGTQANQQNQQVIFQQGVLLGGGMGGPGGIVGIALDDLGDEDEDGDEDATNK